MRSGSRAGRGGGGRRKVGRGRWKISSVGGGIPAGGQPQALVRGQRAGHAAHQPALGRGQPAALAQHTARAHRRGCDAGGGRSGQRIRSSNRHSFGGRCGGSGSLSARGKNPVGSAIVGEPHGFFASHFQVKAGLVGCRLLLPAAVEGQGVGERGHRTSQFGQRCLAGCQRPACEASSAQRGWESSWRCGAAAPGCSGAGSVTKEASAAGSMEAVGVGACGSAAGEISAAGWAVRGMRSAAWLLEEGTGFIVMGTRALT